MKKKLNKLTKIQIFIMINRRCTTSI